MTIGFRGLPASASTRSDRVEIFGVRVHDLAWRDLLARIAAAIGACQTITVGYVNVHVLNLAFRDPELRAFLNAVDLCYCDGNGVRVGAFILGGQLRVRLTGADWIWDLAREAEGRWRIYWIGGEPGVTREAAEALRTVHPRLEIGTDHGFHPRNGPEDDACLERIGSFGPDIVLVGMGSPIQEMWVRDRRARIAAPVVWCLGATADFVSGRVRRPGPRWILEHHEWASRFVADPRRLWRRYLLGNAIFLQRVAWARLREWGRRCARGWPIRRRTR